MFALHYSLVSAAKKNTVLRVVNDLCSQGDPISRRE